MKSRYEKIRDEEKINESQTELKGSQNEKQVEDEKDIDKKQVEQNLYQIAKLNLEDKLDRMDIKLNQIELKKLAHLAGS